MDLNIMDFDWSEEQQVIHDAATSFARRELDFQTASRDNTSEFSSDLWRKCGREGILGSFIPKTFGGRGYDMLTTIYMLEGLGYGCRDNGLTLALNGQLWSVQQPILQFGSEDQKRRFLPGLCSGEILAADGATEPEAGSDAMSIRTTATRCEGGYRLNGHKTYIGMAPIADFSLVFAATDPELKQWGLSVFLVEQSSEGYWASPPVEKMGLRTVPMGDLRFKDCFVPEANRLGPEGAGGSIFANAMEWERAFIFASHVGAMHRQLDQCIAYANDRRQFGKQIGQFQSVSNRIADMRVRLETSRFLLYKLAWEKDRGRSTALESAMSKLHLSEAFVASSFDAIRIHGGRGFVSEAEVERDLRDSVGGVIYGGTSDIQRVVIAKLLGLS